jgi:hypothetical protein
MKKKSESLQVCSMHNSVNQEDEIRNAKMNSLSLSYSNILLTISIGLSSRFTMYINTTISLS